MSVSAADAYDRFMGRYSRLLAVPFADFAGLPPVGARRRLCGVLVEAGRLGRAGGARSAGHAPQSSTRGMMRPWPTTRISPTGSAS